MHVFKVAVVLFLLSLSTTLLARPSILSDWNQIYPNSSSDDAGCQLCHASGGGDQPWNAYGWEIKDILDGGGVLPSEAISLAETVDLYSDPSFPSPLDEIKRGFQPGWRSGALNTHFFTDEMMNTVGNEPPEGIVATEIDFPIAEANATGTTITVAAEALDLNEIAAGFNAPVRAVKAPGIDGSLFVVEQSGKIFRVELASGTKSLFLDVSSDLVEDRPGFDERGLLGLAFHPDFASNGLLYTYQSEPLRPEQDSIVDFPVVSNDQYKHRSMVVEYKASDPSCNSIVSKRRILMAIEQPQFNHDGGDLVFDINKHLYIALGDGGSADDVGPGHGDLGNGRDKSAVLGSILRIDPLGNNSDNGKYGVPINNPFFGSDPGADEIFAYGFRNPYRMSIDAADGISLYSGDVGQEDIEEINLVELGGNYGWNWKEGDYFFYTHSNRPMNDTSYVSTVAPPDLPNDLVDPIGKYDQSEGISVIGGYVYRNNTIANTEGFYVFGEFSGPNFGTPTGRLFRLNRDTGAIEEFPLMSSIDAYVTGFGQDADNELYVVTNETFSQAGVNGKLLKLVEAGDAVTFPNADGESAMCPPDETMCIPIKTTNGVLATICL